MCQYHGQFSGGMYFLLMLFTGFSAFYDWYIGGSMWWLCVACFMLILIIGFLVFRCPERADRIDKWLERRWKE